MKVEYLPPSIVKGEPYAIDEGYFSDLCRFVTLMMSMPPMSGAENDIYIDIEIVFEGELSDGGRPRIILFLNPVLRQYFILKKDVHPESSRCYLLLQQFDFEVHDKG